MIKFTQITNALKYPHNFKSNLLLYHSNVVEYVIKNFSNTARYKRKVLYSINIISYIVVSGDFMPVNWVPEKPMDNLPDIDDSEIENKLTQYGLYLDMKNVEWDVEEIAKPSSMYVPPQNAAESKSAKSSKLSNKSVNMNTASTKELNSQFGGDLIAVEANDYRLVLDDATPKEDLYIQHPVVPRFNTKKAYVSGTNGNDLLAIYTSLPEIPKRQCDISITTDINLFSDSDLMNLYPKQFIPTRAPIMYERIDGLDYEDKLGVILKISDYSKDQIIDNMIKYPHLYQLMKFVNGEYVSFYGTIEISRELCKIQDVWDDLEDTRCIPKTKEFMKEYVVRRYLLERDISNVQHRYPLWGSLDPFLTLFMPPDEYIKYGYTDIIDLARKCVESRVSYRKSRNPIVRRLSNV